MHAYVLTPRPVLFPSNVAPISNQIQATREEVAAQRVAAAIRLQRFVIKQGDRHRLSVRFKARKGRLDFERRNRTELASAILVLQQPFTTVRDYSEQEDFEVGTAVGRPFEGGVRGGKS